MLHRLVWSTWGLKTFNRQSKISKHSPAPVHEFHWLHCQRRGNDVIRVVPPSAHHDEPVHLSGDEDEASGADEAQQAGPHEGVLADQPPAGAHRVDLRTQRTFSRRHGNRPGLELKSDVRVFLTLDFYIDNVTLLVFNKQELMVKWALRRSPPSYLYTELPFTCVSITPTKTESAKSRHKSMTAFRHLRRGRRTVEAYNNLFTPQFLLQRQIRQTAWLYNIQCKVVKG